MKGGVMSEPYHKDPDDDEPDALEYMAMKAEYFNSQQFACKMKSKFATQADANFSIKKLTEKHSHMKYRAYFCECGLWHISTKEAYASEKLLKEIEALNKTIAHITGNNNRFKERNKKLSKEVENLRQQISQLMAEKMQKEK